MKFRMLQENLRKTLWEYIDAGELTGLRLAEQTGFKQAHISNFLNRKRGLSLEGVDRVLNVQHLSVLDLNRSGRSQQARLDPPAGRGRIRQRGGRRLAYRSLRSVDHEHARQGDPEV
jgi:hypothetical protein